MNKQSMTVEQAAAEGYMIAHEIPGRGMCGIMRMVCTWGLFYGLEANPFYRPYDGRYCFPDLASAVQAILQWDGIDDPPGPWIKHKGHIEYNNPKNQNSYDSSTTD